MSTELTKHSSKRQQNEIAESQPTRAGVTFSPRIDIWECQDELVLFADMPGVTSEGLDVQFENRELRIHGKVSPRQEGITFLYGEYGIGDFYRSFTIGETIDAERISAELADGVLTIHLPKVEAVKPRRIEVKAR
jgi:HSP20 family molecular chaperone IbpA